VDIGTIHRAQRLKEYIWDNVEVGEEYGPVEGIVSDHHVKNHAYATDDYARWYFEDSPEFGGRIAPPMLLANDILRLFLLAYDSTNFSSGLHARNEVWFFSPIYVGQGVTIRGKNIEKYQKRGNNYRVLEGEVLNNTGKLLLRMRAVETVGLYADSKVGQRSGEPARNVITGEVPPGSPVVSRASCHVPEGAVLPSLVKHASLPQSIVFSGFPFGWVEGSASTMRHCIHTVPEEAQRRGQPGVIVQGLMSKAYLAELCMKFYGPGWLTTGHISVAFIRPVIARDTITACGMAKRVFQESGETRIELDLWCKNQRQELITVGHATGPAA
jgi:acyl dehydratase